MRNITIKILSVLAIIALGLSLAACGKGSKGFAEEDSEDSKYEYVSKNSEHEFSFADEYLVCSEVQGDVLTGIKMRAEEKDGSYILKYFYGEYNFADGTKEETEIPADVFGESFNINKFHTLEDGRMIIIGAYYNSDSFEQTYEVKILKNFALEKSIPLASDITDGGFINRVEFTDENMFFDIGNAIVVTDYEGKMVCKIIVDSWVGQMFSLPDGSIAVTFSDMTNNYETVTKKIDVAAKGFGEAVDIEVGDGNVFSGKDRTVLIMTNTALKKWDPQTKETKELFQLMNADIYNNYFENITEGENDTYYFFTSDYDDETYNNIYRRIEVRKVEASKNGKQKLTYGCLYLDWDIKERIAEFNQSSDKYKIVIKDYSEGTDDWEGAESRFKMDIASGDVIDIIDCSSISYLEYLKSGVFEDLSQYFNDSGITEENYYTGAFEAYKSDGKLFVLPTAITFQTIATPSRIANGKTSWTINDVFELRKQYPDISFIDYPSKSTALFEVIMGCYADFVDAANAECHFDSEEFVSLLNFANTFRNDEEVFSQDVSSMSEVQKGNVLMYSLYIYDGSAYSMAENLYGEPITLIGFPSSTGAGTIINSQGLMALSSKSKNKEGAWEFIKSGLSESNQNKVFSGFPILKKAFDVKMKEATTEETYIDENGETHVQPHGSMSDGIVTIEMTSLSKDGEKVLRNLMENCADFSAATYYDEEVIAIISEEAEGFFAGQKKAEDVAAVIQSRVKIYLAEQN